MKEIIKEISAKSGVAAKDIAATWVAILAEAVAQVAALTEFDNSKHTEKAIIRQIRMQSRLIFIKYDRVGSEVFKIKDTNNGELKHVPGDEMYEDMQNNAEKLFNAVAGHEPREILRSLAEIALSVVSVVPDANLAYKLKNTYETFFKNCARLSAENKEITELLINKIQSL